MSDPTLAPFETIELEFAGRRVALPDLPEYRKFYRKLVEGRWEPQTFATIARYVDDRTVHIDIGAWIGVTPFWAAQQARAVIAVDPDPKCAAILRRLAADQAAVTVLEGALSDRDSLSVQAVDGFGSSETSALAIGNGGRAQVPGLRMRAVLDLAGDAPAFVKIDIEGYEYLIADEFDQLGEGNVRAVQLAVHPQLYARSLSGPSVLRRIRVALATWRLARRFRRRFSGPAMARHRSLAAYVWNGILAAPAIRGTDFVFERRATAGKDIAP